MHLLRPGLAEHAHQGPLGVAADDGVVDHHESFARDDLLQRVQFQPDAELSDGLAGLDERATHVGVLHQSEAERDSGGLRVSDGRGCTGVGGGDHQVGLDGVFAGEDTTDLDTGGVDAASRDGGVGAGQVDVFEQAALRGGLGETPAAQTCLVDRDEFAGLHLPDETGPHDVQGGGLGGHHPAGGEPPQDEGTHALRVAGGEQRRLVDEG